MPELDTALQWVHMSTWFSMMITCLLLHLHQVFFALCHKCVQCLQQIQTSGFHRNGSRAAEQAGSEVDINTEQNGILHYEI